MATQTTITRRTVTTTNAGGVTGPTTVIPLWTIKLITAVLCLIILIIILLQDVYSMHNYPRTFIVIVLTCGFILGWSIQAVLHRFLNFYRVDATLHTIICSLTFLSLILCVIYLIEQRDYSRGQAYSYMVGITICMGVTAFLFLFLIGCLWRGNYTIVDTH
uniref:MARVEL domain-containing protein n=1 Tax=Panagrolaimus sp. JU765 TaxID=591449 RepID=A0AC34Q2G5_9BILA